MAETVAFRCTTGDLTGKRKYVIPRITGKKYRGAERHFFRGFITKCYGVEPEIVIYV